MKIETQYVDLVEQVYQRVKQMIFDQELIPGQKIVQEKLAAELGVSRSPLLKALQKLETELLVESIPRRGMVVKELSNREIIEIFNLRSVIEGLSARLSAENVNDADIKKLKSIFGPFVNKKNISVKNYEKADREFHSVIMRLSGNQMILRQEMLNNINLNAYQVGVLRPPEETLSEHFAVIEAIESKNGKLAEKLMRAHIDKSINEFEKRIDRGK